ncbi:MAG: MucB/RseB C-terminal domain-containing protein [Betaproteobacteria bacterium]|nr:MucB/RseB C-terminal domain-containing protein [Betaproteobacteria bacterium]
MRGLTATLPWLALAGAVLPAAAAPGSDPIAWLQRAADSARTTTFAGTVVHMTGERTSTSRITHIFLSGSEHEKIESLDGPRREIVRHNEDLQCFYPDAKTVRLDRRVTARFFPAVVSGPVASIAENYTVKLGEVERVLGQDCRWIHLDPRDALRYAQRLCAELGSGLVMRARTLSRKGQVIEQFTFTDLRMGPQVSRGEVKSTFYGQSKDWRTDTQPRDEVKEVDTGWTVTALPPGFRKVKEMARRMPGRDKPVSQIVYTDGVASFSVFVESAASGARVPESTQTEEGDLSVFVGPVGESQVTVLGEVPPVTAQQVGRSVARRP